MDFSGPLEAARGGGAVVRVPDGMAASFGTRRAFRVAGTLNGVPYRSNVMPLGGGAFALGVHKAVREAAGVAFGDVVAVTMEPYDAPREVEVPAELATALAESPDAAACYDALAPSHRREYATWVAAAKQQATRDRRAAQAVERLRRNG